MKSTRSVGCNHFEEMYVIQNLFRYVINPKKVTYKSCDLMTYSRKATDYILANARLHTNPSDWIKIKDYRSSPLFFGAANQSRTGDLILTKDALYLLSHSSIFIGDLLIIL